MAKKRISASIDLQVVDNIEVVRKIEKRSFSSMFEILLQEALKARKIK